MHRLHGAGLDAQFGEREKRSFQHCSPSQQVVLPAGMRSDLRVHLHLAELSPVRADSLHTVQPANTTCKTLAQNCLARSFVCCEGRHSEEVSHECKHLPVAFPCCPM